IISLTGVLFWRWYRLDHLLRGLPSASSTAFLTVTNSVNETEIGCVFPEVNPYSHSLEHNVDLPKIACEEYDWVECNMSKCGVKQHILDTVRDIVCYYRDIISEYDHNYTIAEPVKLLHDQVYTLQRSDYFKVSCTGYEKNGYGLIASRWYGYKVGVRPQNPPSSAKRNNSLNILIVGFDSTSRGGFMLKLPKSFRVLINEMDAVLLKGYNIVGDGTAEALFPILSGKTDIQHHPHARQMHSKDTLLDPDLFIFQTAREDGYHTAYYEDMPWIGSFQFRYNGFKKRPADHYLRSFFMEQSQRGLKWLSGIRRRYCVGEKPTFLVLLDLTRQFMKVKGKRLCFTFMGDVSHDDFNRISTVDDDLVEFLRHIKQSGYLEDTMLIVMGDHGPRFGPWRESDQGKVDERLPFMSIVLPERLKRERPDALGILQANALVLTTPFDIHTTLLDAMDLSQHASDFVVPNAVLKRGLSLLKQIPRSRTCEEAEVTPHWCVCLNTASRNVESHDPMYERVVDTLLKFINDVTEEKRSVCAVRSLSHVMWVSRQDPSGPKSSAANVTRVVYYKTLIILTPGPAAFEASMQFHPQRDRFVISERDISRITAYGTEPACVSATHPHLNKYCYCVVSQFSALKWLKL
ncbi:uncharacterized protein LOC120634720, partial [Pararge aegeria]|uniref:uncharacterized protein LOC120634720 n=1 Tax=Pararge aegeria TaxID=116150 RepID=UPI0019D2E070